MKLYVSAPAAAIKPRVFTPRGKLPYGYTLALGCFIINKGKEERECVCILAAE